MPSPPSQNSEESSFEQELEAVGQSLHDLKTRHAQVQQDQVQQSQLQQRRDRVKQELQARSRQLQPELQPELKAELQQIQTQLDELEIKLESRLFGWDSLREPFWQIVRFGGVGLVVGWSLAFWVIQGPKPAPPVSPNSFKVHGS